MRNNKKHIANKFLELIELIKKLRAPDGCPWDREQTQETLLPYLLEETYEVIEAIEEKNSEGIKEELGDLMLHILFQSEIASELNQFTIIDSLENVITKLINRHPNVFNKNSISDKKGTNISWELSKQKEKKRKNILDGVPKTLPALIRSSRIQEKAANIGFDWKEISPVLNKINEELSELNEAIEYKNKQNVEEEMGDLLFSLVNLSRHLNINAEDALRKTILKFELRFSEIEKELKRRNKTFMDSNLEEMDKIWNDIKKKASM